MFVAVEPIFVKEYWITFLLFLTG